MAAAVAASVAVAIGATVQGSVGFGMSLVAVPLLVLIDPRLVPGPLLCVAIVLTFLLSRRDRRAIDFHELKWALAGRIPGSFLGAGLLVVMPREKIAYLFGAVVLIAVVMSVLRIKIRPAPSSLAGAGLLSGVMGTSVAIGGPPIALLLQDEHGARLRGTLSGFFLVGASVSLFALVLVARFGLEELALALVLLPGMLLGFWISGHTARFLDRGYTRVAILLLATAGAVVIILRQVL